MLRKCKQVTFADGILLAAILLVGGFHEYISCLLSVAMCGYLLWKLKREKKLRLQKSPLALAVLFICLSYGTTCLWAVDRGMALVGFLKFLPLLLYLLCLWQTEKQGCALAVMPYVGAAMAVISAVGMQFEALKSAFSVVGRLSGFFQYPNTFALFLLVCQLLLLKKEYKRIWDYLTVLILVAELLYTGSRTVFVVFALSNVAMLFAVSRKRGRTVLLILAAVVCVAAVILSVGENSVLRRYLVISLTESTFVGRVLYVVDALPLILKYPFGMGYLGYSYIQHSVQTGVYSVTYIHNDFMQLLLDVGILPFGLFAWALVSWFSKKQVLLTDKIIAGAVCLHGLFDFDLQFVGMFRLLLTLVQPPEQKPGQIKTLLPMQVSAVASVALSLYIGTALLLAHMGACKAADVMFPGNTRNKLILLEQETDIDRANALADGILKNNEAYFAAYSVKAKYAYSGGDFASLIRYKNMVFDRSPFAYQEYEEYCTMLINGIVLYEQAGDYSSARACREELIATRDRLESNAQRLSGLGKLIVDQPQTRLPEEITAVIDQLERSGQ